MDTLNDLNNNVSDYYDKLINTDMAEDKINDIYKIIQNKYKTYTSNKDSIYDEIMKKEKNIKEVIDRVIEYKENEKKKDLFINTSFNDICLNIFKVLNNLIDDLTKYDKISYKQLKKIVKKKHRLIYIGLFMIIISIFLSLIEISDKV
jgi:hypothetical protein